MQQISSLRTFFSSTSQKKQASGLAAGWLTVPGSTNQRSSHKELKAFAHTVIKLAGIARFVFIPRVSLHVFEGFPYALKRKCTGCSLKM